MRCRYDICDGQNLLTLDNTIWHKALTRIERHDRRKRDVWQSFIQSGQTVVATVSVRTMAILKRGHGLVDTY